MSETTVDARPAGLRKTRVALAAAMLLTGVVVRSQTPTPQQIEALVDRILSERDSPAASDLSVQAFASQLARTKALLAELRGVDPSALSADEALDRRFLESFLVGRELAQVRMRFWRMDPRVYMRSFQTVAAALGGDGAETARADILLRALQAIPNELRQGQKNLSLHAPRFQELSVAMDQNATILFTSEVPAFAESVPAHKQALLAANSAAQKAYDQWVTFLKLHAPRRPTGYFAIGIETYDAMLEAHYLLPYDSDSLYKLTQDELRHTTGELEELATKIDPKKSWLDIINEGQVPDPDATKDPAKEIELHQERIAKSREHLLSEQLIPIPWKERVDVVPRAPHLPKTTDHGDFSSAASRPPAPDGTLVAEWHIDGLNPHDLGTISVMAARETYGGRHVQTLYQMHNPRKVRRSLSSAMFTEGWALYNEQLMQETGLSPDERVHLRQLQLRLFRIARAMADVGMHTGRMTYADTIALMTDKVGLVAAAATTEADALMVAPGDGLHGFIGMVEILKMREEFKHTAADRFSLGDFHERLLKIGAMPPALMREALMRQ